MLKVSNLKKNYGDIKALDGLNLTVKQGNIYGLIGPNGAGKSTLMRICMGLLTPDAGEVKAFGYDVFDHTDYIRESVGYMSDNFGQYEKMTVREYIEFYGNIYGMDTQYRKYWQELLDMVHLADKQNVYVDTLSRGMKQRLGIARCMVHNPTLLLLDEPMAGLDPEGRSEIVNVMNRLKQTGKTILLSSNTLSELEGTCTQIGIIKNGVMKIEGTMDEIVNQMNDSSPISITVFGNVHEAIQVLRQNPQVTRISTKGDTLYIGFNGTKEQESKIAKELALHDVGIVNFSRIRGSLENLFFEIANDSEERRKQHEDQSRLYERFKIKR